MIVQIKIRTIYLSSYGRKKGRMIIIDEFDNLPENYQNIFLQISGEGGRLVKKIISYSNSGVVEYKVGKKTRIGFAANYPLEGTGKRNISTPMSDRLDWYSITLQESLEDEGRMIKEYSFKKGLMAFAGFEAVKEDKIEKASEKIEEELPKYRKIEAGFKKALQEGDPEVSKKILENIQSILARSMWLLHKSWKIALRTYRSKGIEIPGGKPRSREQIKGFSQRAVAGVENAVLANLDNPAYINPSTGYIDITEIFFDAFQAKYLNFLANKELKLKFKKEQMLPVLYGGKKEMKESGEGIELKTTPELGGDNVFLYVEDEKGTFIPYSKKDEGKPTYSMEEALNILVERAFSSTKEGEEVEKREKLEKQQAEFDAQDAVEKLLNNPDIPQSVKDIFKGKL